MKSSAARSLRSSRLPSRSRHRPKTFNQIDRQVADQIMSRVSPARPLCLSTHRTRLVALCCCHNTTLFHILPHHRSRCVSLSSLRRAPIGGKGGPMETNKRANTAPPLPHRSFSSSSSSTPPSSPLTLPSSTI